MRLSFLQPELLPKRKTLDITAFSGSEAKKSGVGTNCRDEFQIRKTIWKRKNPSSLVA